MEVFLIAALTADGFIAKDAADVSTRWTSKEDAAFFGEKTKAADAVIFGSKTFETIGRALPGRKIVVQTRDENTWREKWSDIDPEKVWPSSLAPSDLIAKFQTDGLKSVAVGGGASIYTQYMQAGLVDRLFLTVEPVIFGEGMTLFNAPVGQSIFLAKTHQLSDQTIVQEYFCDKS